MRRTVGCIILALCLPGCTTAPHERRMTYIQAENTFPPRTPPPDTDAHLLLQDVVRETIRRYHHATPRVPVFTTQDFAFSGRYRGMMWREGNSVAYNLNNRMLTVKYRYPNDSYDKSNWDVLFVHLDRRGRPTWKLADWRPIVIDGKRIAPQSDQRATLALKEMSADQMNIDTRFPDPPPAARKPSR